jgi:hypothetical protein
VNSVSPYAYMNLVGYRHVFNLGSYGRAEKILAAQGEDSGALPRRRYEIDGQGPCASGSRQSCSGQAKRTTPP